MDHCYHRYYHHHHHHHPQRMDPIVTMIMMTIIAKATTHYPMHIHHPPLRSAMPWSDFARPHNPKTKTTPHKPPPTTRMGLPNHSPLSTSIPISKPPFIKIQCYIRLGLVPSMFYYYHSKVPTSTSTPQPSRIRVPPIKTSSKPLHLRIPNTRTNPIPIPPMITVPRVVIWTVAVTTMTIMMGPKSIPFIKPDLLGWFSPIPYVTVAVR